MILSINLNPAVQPLKNNGFADHRFAYKHHKQSALLRRFPTAEQLKFMLTSKVICVWVRSC